MPRVEQVQCHCEGPGAFWHASCLDPAQCRASTRAAARPMHRCLATSRHALMALLAMATLLFAGCAEVPNTAVKRIAPPVFPPPPEAPRFIYERSLHSSADVLPDEKDAGLR